MSDAFFLLVIVLAIFLFHGDPDFHDRAMAYLDRPNCESAITKEPTND